MKRNLLLFCFISLFINFSFAQFTLKHAYTFTDGTAIDEVSGANGTITGGEIINGAYVTTANGQFIVLPAADIKINEYTSITFEAYTLASKTTPDNSMLWYFGGSLDGYGSNGTFFAPLHWGAASRAGISCLNTTSPWSAESFVDGAIVNTLDEMYHIVMIITGTNISYYLNGALVGTSELTADNKIANLTNENAWIARGGYSADQTWLGTLFEFNIYSGVMDDATIYAHSLDFPFETSIPTLASLKTNIGELSPVFDPETTDYEITVPFGITSLILTALPTETGSKVQFYDGVGNEFTNGVITFGNDGVSVEIVVTGLDGSSFSYYIEIFIDNASSNTLLANIELSKGELSPAFSKETYEYNVIFPVGTSSVNITATPVVAEAKVTGSGVINLQGFSGTITVTCTSANGAKSQDYIIHYKIESPLTLKHAYTFIDGTAQDMIGGADGIVVGGNINDGIYTASALGEYIALPAADIAINSYVSLTVEAYVLAGTGVNTGHTMLSYFGNTVGSYGTDYFFTTLANGGKSRAAMSVGNTSSPWSAESGTDGVLVDDGNAHHLVSTLTYDTITWYIDGVLAGKAALSESNIISKLSNNLAYLGKGGYTGDETWIGSIYEFNIYNGVMDEQTVALHFIDFPSNEDESTNATLSALTVNGDTIEGFSPYTLSYDISLEAGNPVPTVGATPKNAGASAIVTAATGIPGTATVLVTAANGKTTNTYTINFKVEGALSDDATLSNLSVNGTTITGFDPATLTYNVKLNAGTTVVPTVTAATTHPNATLIINNANSVTGSTTVQVTAEDGKTTATYTINFSVETGINNQAAQTINVFPTITNNHFVVQTPKGESLISMFDITGKMIKTMTSSATSTNIEAPKQGMYIIVVKNENTVQTFKVIKK